jgi:hypothetical protein
MTTVQIIMTNRNYANELERLLVRDGQHRVLQVEAPDASSSGVVVMDSVSFREFSGDRQHADQVPPEKVVLVADHEAGLLGEAWEAGLRSVVYSDEPVQTTLLAVIAAELRLLEQVGLAWAPVPG